MFDAMLLLKIRVSMSWIMVSDAQRSEGPEASLARPARLTQTSVEASKPCPEIFRFSLAADFRLPSNCSASRESCQRAARASLRSSRYVRQLSDEVEHSGTTSDSATCEGAGISASPHDGAAGNDAAWTETTKWTADSGVQVYKLVNFTLTVMWSAAASEIVS